VVNFGADSVYLRNAFDNSPGCCGRGWTDCGVKTFDLPQYFQPSPENWLITEGYLTAASVYQLDGSNAIAKSLRAVYDARLREPLRVRQRDRLAGFGLLLRVHRPPAQ
jgi:hypothetical protein